MRFLRLQALLRTPSTVKSRKKDMGSHQNMGSVLQLPLESRETHRQYPEWKPPPSLFPLPFALPESCILSLWLAEPDPLHMQRREGSSSLSSS